MSYRRIEPYLYFIIICAIWGGSFILMKKASLAFGPISIGAGRVLGGALALALVFFLQRKPWPLTRKFWGPMSFVVLVGYIGPYTLQPYLVSHYGSGFIGMMVSFVPLMTIIVSIPMLRVYPTARQVVGVLGGLACIGLVLSDGVERHIPFRDLAIAAAVPLAYAIVNTYIKRRFVGVSPLMISLGALALASSLLLPIAVALPSEQVKPGPHLGLAIGCVAVLGVLGTGVAIYMFYKLVQDHGPLFAGMVTYLVPVGAIVLGWLDDEKVTALQLTALGGIFAMVALVQYGSATVASDECRTASGEA